MPTSKYLKRAVLWLVLLGLLNAGLNFAMTPAYGSARVMWDGYVREENLDVIYVGSSVTQMNINPYEADRVSGHNSYNMGTVGQSPECTVLALERAIKDHPIQTVVYGVAYSTFNNEQAPESQIAFGTAYKEVSGLKDGLRMDLSFMKSREHMLDESSIQYFMPWTINHCSLNPKAILSNMKEKLNHVPAGDSLNMHPQEADYVGKGFESYHGTLDYNAVGDNLATNIYDKTFYGPAMDSLREIIELCRKNNIELIVVNPPKPEYDIISFGQEYDDMKHYMEEFLGAYGVEYVDFGLARPELFVSDPSYYHNFDHLTREGADAFSASLGALLKAYENGEDIHRMFYSYDEFLDAYEHISSVTFAMETENSILHVKPQVFAGRHVETEISWTLKGPHGEELTSMDKTPSFELQEEGIYTLTMKAVRKDGSDERTCTKVLRYYPDRKETAK